VQWPTINTLPVRKTIKDISRHLFISFPFPFLLHF